MADDPGVQKIEWARRRMGMLARAGKEISDSGSLDGLNVAMALHVEAKTAVLALTLADAGANVRLAGCNPLSTDDEVSRALKKDYGLDVFARRGVGRDEYYENLHKTVAKDPHVVIDDGGDLTTIVHAEPKLLKDLRGICEETTTGIIRAHAMHAAGALKVALLDINGAKMKHLFDNRYGTGQSALDGFLRATNLSIAGKTFVVVGYGWCGRGVAMRARGMGAEVLVAEVDPVRAIEARYDGFGVGRLTDLLPRADVVITATGNAQVVAEPHIPKLRDGVILANAGHFDNEVYKPAFDGASADKREVRAGVTEYELKDGRRVYLLAEGRLVNLAAGSGHPVEVMDGSFALQALGAAYLADNGRDLGPGVHPVPAETDAKVARYALDTLGIQIDELTDEQRRYLASYAEGT